MAQVCLPAGCIDAIRIALVDDCSDEPVPGLSNGYLFNCFRNLSMTKNVEDGDETVLKNDCGRKCFQTKKCDELKDIQIEFELLNPDYELISLLTGQPLINDGIENIGWYQEEGLNCTPWVSVEMFEQVPDESCTAGHKYRRIVLPKVRFKLPMDEKEDPFRLVKMEGRTSPSELANWGDGPFNDSPFDFSAVPAGVQTHIMEFFDDTITDTLDGQCGFIEVPSAAVIDLQSAIETANFGEIDITGTGMTGAQSLVVIHDGPASPSVFNPPTWSDVLATIQSDDLIGRAVSSIEAYTDFPPTALADTLAVSLQPAGPRANFFQSLSLGRIQVVGQFFLAGNVDRIVIEMDDTSFENFYNPFGPNAGLNAPSLIVQWSQNSIIIEDSPLLSGRTASRVGLEDLTSSYFIYFDLADQLIM